MALKTDLTTYPIDVLSNLLNKGGKYIAQGIKIATTDYMNLIQKAADFKISQLGTIVLDHITFYINDYDIGTGYYQRDKNKNIIGDKLGDWENNKIRRVEAGDIETKAINVYDTKVAELERLNRVFKKQDGSEGRGNIEEYSVTLKHVFINVNKSNIIIGTDVKGMNGKFKQYWGSDDYNISLTGILAGNNQHQTDVDTIQKLNVLFSLGRSIRISSIYLNSIFDIDEVVITDYSFDQDKTYGNLTQFNINMLSDEVNTIYVNPTSLTNY